MSRSFPLAVCTAGALLAAGLGGAWHARQSSARRTRPALTAPV